MFDFADLTYIVTILTSVGEASTDPVTLRLRGESSIHNSLFCVMKWSEIIQPCFSNPSGYFMWLCCCVFVLCALSCMVLFHVLQCSMHMIAFLITELITDPSDGPTISATSDSSDDGTRYYKEAAFITGMVILGVCLLFIVGAVFLCFVRPLGDPGFLPGSPQSISTRLDTPTKHGSPVNHLDTSSKRSNTTKRNRNSRGTMAGSWTPGQPIWVHTLHKCT